MLLLVYTPRKKLPSGTGRISIICYNFQKLVVWVKLVSTTLCLSLHGQTNKIDRAIRAADNLPRIVVLHCRGVQNEDNTEAYNLLLKTLSLRLGCGALIKCNYLYTTEVSMHRDYHIFPN